LQTIQIELSSSVHLELFKMLFEYQTSPPQSHLGRAHHSCATMQ